MTLAGTSGRAPQPAGGTAPVTAGSATAARLTIGATFGFLVLLALLHFLQPELSPTWQFTSEYALGDYGWIMKLNFFVLALGCASVIRAVRSQVPTRRGRVGLFLLGGTVVGMVLAGLFDQAPMTSTEVSVEGSIHGLGALIGIPGFTVGSLLVGRSIARTNPAWAPVRGTLSWLSRIPWISLVAMVVYMGVAVPLAGGVGPQVWAGLFNRLFLVAMCAWLLFVAWRVLALPRTAGRR